MDEEKNFDLTEDEETDITEINNTETDDNAPEEQLSDEGFGQSFTDEADELSNAEDGQTEHDEILDLIENNGDNVTPPASKKTTIVLLSIIIVLVAIIVVFAVLFLRDYNKKKKAAESQQPSDGIETVVPSNNQSGQSSSPVSNEPVEFDVTATLGQYKGIEVDYECREITDEDIQNEIDYLLESNAVEVEVTDRPVQEGDVVNIDYAGYMNDEQFEGGTDTGYDLEIGSGSFIDGFESGLIGASVGDTVDLNIAFPDPYPNNPDLAGQPVLFVVAVNSITAYETAEFTDEFVAENTEYSTVAEYMEGTRAELEAAAADEAQSMAETAVFDKLVENTVYGGEIDEEIAFYTQQYMNYYDQMANAYYGCDGATFFSYIYGVNAEEYRQMLEDEAANMVKYQYALDEVAKAEGLTVSEEDYEAEFKAIFIDEYGYTSKEEVLADISQEEMDQMVNESVLRRKAEAVVIDNAIINK